MTIYIDPFYTNVTYNLILHSCPFSNIFSKWNDHITIPRYPFFTIEIRGNFGKWPTENPILRNNKHLGRPIWLKPSIQSNNKKWTKKWNHSLFLSPHHGNAFPLFFNLSPPIFSDRRRLFNRRSSLFKLPSSAGILLLFTLSRPFISFALLQSLC